MHAGVGSRRIAETRGRRLGRFTTALAVAVAAGIGGAPPAAAAPPTTYENPISRSFADTFADPAILKAKDGAWYSYATSDPLREGERTFHIIPQAKSDDMVNWTYAGDAFNAQNRPTWAAPTAGIWAPDVRYIDGRYVMYFGVTDTTLFEGPNDSAIGVATSPTPTGPWTDSGAPVVGPRPAPSGNPGDFLWTFDSTGFTDVDGSHYLYFGSYYGGISVTKLTPDGLRAVGPTPRIAIDNRYEAAYVVRRDGWVYFFGSSANCCAGPTTGYSVYVGRSRSPLEPPVDRDGISLNESRVGGTIVITPNGNRWIGPGHNSIATDLSGQDWFVYHAIDRSDPWLDEPFGINERPMLMDRLDWIDGWPTVRGGRWASEGPQTGPVTTPDAGADFNAEGATLEGWRNLRAWDIVRTESEGFVRQRANSCNRPRFLLTGAAAPTDVRAEADVRLSVSSAGGVVVRHQNVGTYAVASIDGRRRALVVEAYVRGERVRRQVVALAADFPLGVWHNVAVEVRGTTLTAEVTDARLNDPYAEATIQLPAALAEGGAAGVASTCGRIDADNIAVTELYVPQEDVAEVPTLGERDAEASDLFNGAALDEDWEWVRGPDPAAQVTGGSLRWPVQQADTTGPGGNASLLLRDAPTGNYVAETTCTILLGTDVIRNYQQCGIVAYVNDDLFVRLSHVSIWNTRQTEFLREEPEGEPGADGVQPVSTGGMLVGTPATKTWLRLAHRIDPENGEHEYRAATSRDGRNFTWGGVWTLPADTEPRIGLVSLGWNGSDPRAVSEFDGFRVFTGGTWGELG